ncbi:MAG TPA: hypothetical protein VHV54_19550, partial [Candidatus Binatia bacterium]|nr:hypothetical protein [Candidatus Binatia bacterium]
GNESAANYFSGESVDIRAGFVGIFRLHLSDHRSRFHSLGVAARALAVQRSVFSVPFFPP